MRYHSTAGLTRVRMSELIARCWQVHSGRQPGDLERYAFVMPFGKAVSMVLIMARHNLAQQLTEDRTGTGTTNYNKKHHKQAMGLQIAASRDGRLADVSSPVRGSRHDSRALEEVGWAEQITQARRAGPLITVIADTAYIKHTRLTPRKKPRSGRRTS